MRFWQGNIRNFPKKFYDGGVIIGNFDGMHRGHCYIIEKLKQYQQYPNQPKILLSFEPHPKQFFDKTLRYHRINNYHQRAEKAKAAGIDAVVICDFDDNFQKMTANAFETEILQQQLHVNYIVIGNDFRYGYNRCGHAQSLSKNPYFKTIILDKIALENDNEITSSSLIRQYITFGNMKKVNLHLGYHFTIEATVITGDREASNFGFPTANLSLKDYAIPAFGVYAMRVTQIGDKICNYPAGGYIAQKESLQQPICEVHLFDFHQNIYGKKIAVELVEFIRPPIKFEDYHHALNQIKKDFDAIRLKIC